MLVAQVRFAKVKPDAIIPSKRLEDAGMDVEPIAASAQIADTGSDWDDGGW